MPKQVIVIMDDHYPFGECEQSTNQNTRVLVRKIYEVSIQQKNKLLDKANILKRLKCQQLIKLESVLEEEESIHFLFEYVPIRLQTWISNINDQFIQNFRDQVIKFSSYLANNFIKIEFRLKNIGMDHNYGAKYFLDPSLIYDPTLNKEKLKSQYIRDISNLFKPYIQSSQEQPQPTASPIQSQPKPLQNKASISPPTYDFQEEPQQQTQSSNNKTKQKLQKYYQHMNASMDVENQKILKQFMDVLDDEDQEDIGKGVTASQQHTRNTPNQYQYGFESEGRKPSSKPEIPLFNQHSNNQQTNNQQNNNQHYNNQSYSNQPYNSNQTNNQPSNGNQNNNQQKNILLSSPSKQSANQTPNFKPSVMTVPQKMTKQSQMSHQQMDQEQVVWKDGDDLQDRIKKAIQNSKSIINRFKTIKQTR